MAFDELQCSRLQREGEILNIIRTNDSLGEYSRYIVAWLYPDRFLTRKSENLYFIDEEGNFSPPAVFPIKSLVFESGGLNLKQFMSNKNHFQVAIAQRVHILEDIIGALNYLHGLSIVHFDLKPENIVCFSSGSGLDTRWKLVDFDSSYDVSTRSHPPVISSSASNDNICVTKEYTSPEVMRALSHSHDAGDLQVTWRLDIWSLGMVAVFLFSNHTLWEVMHPTRPFQNIMVTGITQPQIQLFLSRSFGHKEKSFVEACLQVDPRMRKKKVNYCARVYFQQTTHPLYALPLIR
jgi:serine/threonine protein kinase